MKLRKSKHIVALWVDRQRKTETGRKIDKGTERESEKSQSEDVSSGI